MKLNDKLYDVLKWLCLIAIPAVTVFLQTCLPVWNVSDGVQTIILTTLPAVGTLIGALIAISTANYSSTDDSEDK